jgi:hypothetical protein
MTEAITEAITVGILAGVGAFVGSVYAASRGARMRAPETTAQVYRDLLRAVDDLHRTCVDMQEAENSDQPVDEARAAMEHASVNLAKVTGSASFLIPRSDLDIVDSVLVSDRLPIDERIELVEEALANLRNSASQTFRKRR